MQGSRFQKLDDEQKEQVDLQVVTYEAFQMEPKGNGNKNKSSWNKATEATVVL